MKIFSAFFASFGFAILFNVPKNRLVYSGLCGSCGAIAYVLALHAQMSEAMALFFASMALSATAEIMARILKTPSTLYLICALIPFVPGGGMYYTVLYIIQKNNALALTTGLNTMTQACAIVIGCVLVTGIVHMITQFQTTNQASKQ